jgi:protein-S-isoprenylcysteine O-methyltransferase Ste14
MSTPGPQESSPPKSPGLTPLRLAANLLVVIAILALLLLLPAGRWDWVEAWTFILGYGLFLAAYAIWGLLKDPGQLRERGRIAGNVKVWDKAIIGAYTFLLFATLVLTGFDAGRFRWSSVPGPVQAIAWLGLAAAGALIFWALATNTYLSRMARIQEDRGQVVISSGPYRFVRHPMYLGIILLFVCLPLALGSMWGLIPGSVIGVLFVVRTSKEDRMLREELAGYEQYARRVRFRILPGIW